MMVRVTTSATSTEIAYAHSRARIDVGVIDILATPVVADVTQLLQLGTALISTIICLGKYQLSLHLHSNSRCGCVTSAELVSRLIDKLEWRR